MLIEIGPIDNKVPGPDASYQRVLVNPEEISWARKNSGYCPSSLGIPHFVLIHMKDGSEIKGYKQKGYKQT
jgi:hypothetical protein